MSSSGKCTAVDDETGKPCPCRRCTIPDNPDPDKPLRCLECFHGPSLHIMVAPESNEKKPSVNSILRGLIGSSSASGSRTLALEDAYQEANQGLKKSQSSTTTTSKILSKKGRGQKSKGMARMGRRKDDDDGVFKVMAVVINPDGVEFDDEANLHIVDDHVPNKYEIQTFAKRGLASIDEEGIEFQSNWTHEEVNESLRGRFPRVFEHFDTLGPNLLECKETGKTLDIPPWLLCVPVQRRLKIVPEIYPKGSDIKYNKGTTRAGYRESQVFIVTREAVPEEILATLKTPMSLPLGPVRGKGKEPDRASMSPEPSKARKRHKRLISVTSSGEEDGEGYQNSDTPQKKRAKKGDPVRKWVRPLPEFLTDPVALDISSSSTSSLRALDAPEQHPSMDCDWIDLTALADDGSHLDMSQFPPPALARPVTPPQPTELPDPSFTAVSDVDITLENPWAPGRKFKF